MITINEAEELVLANRNKIIQSLEQYIDSCIQKACWSSKIEIQMRQITYPWQREALTEIYNKGGWKVDWFHSNISCLFYVVLTK